MIEDEQVPRIPHRGHYTADKCAERLEWVREQTGAPLRMIGQYDIDPQELQGNIENFIGMAQVPVGVAGPLLIHGDHVSGYAYAPMATTEGALVASATRGSRGLTMAGGVHVRFVHQHMVRAPLFILDTMADAFRLADWIEAHTEELHVQVRHTSSHAVLTSLRPFVLGNALHLRFVYNTGDASGQNMTTACTWKACQWILENVRDMGIRHFVIEANMSGDKKVSFLSYVDGRGVRIMAETFVSEEILESVFKVTSKALLETVHAFMAGSLHAGMVGFNINVANTIAAIFAATGQDIGSVHESALGQLSVRPAEGGIYASLLLPTLVVGTIGGGTALPTQRECLELMGCYGAGKLGRFAEIVAGYSLALDLSTLSAISGGQFATAHEKLGRNRPEDGLKDEHLTPQFFAAALAQSQCNDAQIAVEEVEAFEIDTCSSILSSLTGTQLKKKVGHFPYRIRYRANGEMRDVKVVVKAKPVDTEVINMLNVMAKGCGGELATKHEEFKTQTGFRNCHIRELAIHSIQDERFTRITPHIYHTWRDDRREIFVIMMEYLDSVSHMNTENRIEAWQPEHIRAVLRDLAGFHAIYFGRTDELEDEWIERPTVEHMIRMRPLWHALVYHHAREFPALYTRQRAVMVHRIINRMSDMGPVLDAAPKTLVHNDFNPRNIALRKVESGGYRLCAYDWELAAVNVPQRDVVEFLAFVLPPETPTAERLAWVHMYRKELEAATGMTLEAGEFERVFNATALDFLVNRLNLYTMAHVFKDYAFLPRVLEGQFRYVEEVLMAYLRAQAPQA
jgi:hydroxymethylglutaryl-CoA reductase (NADPH)